MQNNKKENILLILFSIYSSGIVIQNILATKQIDIFMFTVTTGILISPLLFIIQDTVCETFGYKKAKKMIIIGFLMQLLAVILFLISINIPSSTFYYNQESFKIILGTTMRISIASFIAYIIGALSNSKIMELMKKKKSNSLFKRSIISTIIGQLLDNFIFSIIAFYNILPFNSIISMAIGGTIFEIIYEILFFPITKKIIKKIN